MSTQLEELSQIEHTLPVEPDKETEHQEPLSSPFPIINPLSPDELLA